MAKTYTFRITLYPAKQEIGSVAIAMGSRTYYNDEFVGTFADALVKRSEVSASEVRGHAAFLSMRNRSDRCPPGWNTKNDTLYGGDLSADLYTKEGALR
jgi:hypothetical protein